MLMVSLQTPTYQTASEELKAAREQFFDQLSPEEALWKA